MGESQRDADAQKPFTFQLSTHMVMSPQQINTFAVDKDGNKHPCTAAPSKFGQGKIWDVTFTPPVDGPMTVEVAVGKKPVKGAPLTLNGIYLFFFSLFPQKRPT